MTKRFGEHETGLLQAGPVRPGEGGVLLSGYIGPSMNPTLFEGDMLEILPYSGRSARLGDVVFFRRPGAEGFIVHRVVARAGTAVLTRGDNNPMADPYLLRPADIMGRVVAARRRNRRRRISGGPRGLIRGRLLLSLRSVKRRVSFWLHKPYRLVAASGFGLWLLPAAWRPRCVETDSPLGGKRLHLVFLGKVVGRFDARRKAWDIRRPFRIFVDEAALPRPTESGGNRGGGAV